MYQYVNIFEELIKCVGKDSILLDDNKKIFYETDWRNVFIGPSIAVVFPTNTREVCQIVKACIKYKVKITPQGGNTSKCGGAVPINSKDKHLIVNLSRMNTIINLDKDNYSIVVEAGCTLSQIYKFVDTNNLMFPLKIAAADTCQIGGNISTNAGGINVLKYGTMRELVLGLEAILPNGELVNQLKVLRKDNVNFDLKQLFIGSEGTLGIITKASLKLFPKPSGYFTCLIGVEKLIDCILLLSHLKSNNIIPNSFEVINKTTQAVYNAFFTKIPIESNWLILCEIEIGLEPKLSQIYGLFDGVKSTDIVIASNLKDRDLLWRIRENIPIAEKLYGNALKYDISLPISSIIEFVNINGFELNNTFCLAEIIIFGHLGDGNLHYNIPFNEAIFTENTAELVDKLVYKNVVKFGGSISAEHGIGQLKTTWVKQFYDKNSYNLAKSIKSLIDPSNIFNPGKVFGL